MGRSQGITSTSSRIRSRRNARRRISWVSTTGSSATRNSAKNMFDVGRSEELCREMDKLAKEDHTHHITAEEISVYRNNWWLRSNTVGSDTMPVRHRADFKQALSTLRQLKHQEDTAHQQRWKSYSSSWWNWQESCMTFFLWASPRRRTQHWLIKETCWKVIGILIRGMILRINLLHQYSSTQFTVTGRGV